jgi:4-alpha-glucanotransferase
VVALRDRFGLPGMRVLQFAFDGHGDNPHLPDNYAPNTVVYTGTHDNPTTRFWFEALPERQRQNVWDYLRRPAGDVGEAAPALIELAWNSPAALAMTPLQDLLNLGEEARMNRPGRTEGNWRWRCTEAMPSPAIWQWLHDLTFSANRAPAIALKRIEGGHQSTGIVLGRAV